MKIQKTKEFKHMYTMNGWMVDHNDVLIDMNECLSPSDKDYPFEEDEFEIFNQLPDVITVYRGTCIDEFENEEWGLSWTIDKKVADFFAYKFANSKVNRVIISTTIDKRAIKQIINLRKEYEILLDPYDIDDVNVLK